MLQSLFYLTTAPQVSDITIAQLQEHKTTVTTASGNRYTVFSRYTNKIQLCNRIHYSKVDPFPTQPGQRPVTTWVYKPEAANTVKAPDDERCAARNM
jgi:hypothetical protein